MKNIIADLHCHPTMKPYGRSFPKQLQNISSRNKANIFYYDPETFFDKVSSRIFGLTKFTQSDFTALTKGRTSIVFAALYPMEKGFCRTKYGIGDVMDAAINLAASISKKRIDFIQDVTNGYFPDLEAEYRFLKALDRKTIQINGIRTQYILVNSYSEMIEADHNISEEIVKIYVFISIEGAHAFYSSFSDVGKTSPAVKQSVFEAIDKVKSWSNVPVFITIAHHFWNGFCGHAPSLKGGAAGLITNQDAHLDEGFTDFGREVVRKLLDRSMGKRILIDLKHMSVQSRKDFFQMMDTEYATEQIPLIVSHGAVRGNATNSLLFKDESINFSDLEIVRVAKSKGIFGIQFDKRRIASAGEVKNFNQYTAHSKVMFHAAELIWRQILHIAKVLDAQNLFAWGTQCIGSDNDGIVHALDGVWTAEKYPELQAYLLMHAHNFTKSSEFALLKNPENRVVNGEEIILRFMGQNIYDFLERET